MPESLPAKVLVMDKVAILQPHSGRTVIATLDTEFERLYARSCRLVKAIPVELLYGDGPASSGSSSVGVLVMKSAGVVEQTFGGITSNLWDDPFEWTLPEALSTSARVIEYLREVEETRKHAFACVAGDGDLLKVIATPSGEMRPLVGLILDTLVRALRFQGRAVAAWATVSRSLLSDRQA